MGNEDRRSKVTPETKQEADRLAQLWRERSHPSQAEFGELYGIGNQSAVGQFLRGVTPLSLKAAVGFAKGLGVSIEAFSPRLASEAANIAEMAPGLSPEAAEIARSLDLLTGIKRQKAVEMCQAIIVMANEGTTTRLAQPQPDAKLRTKAA